LFTGLQSFRFANTGADETQAQTERRRRGNAGAGASPAQADFRAANVKRYVHNVKRYVHNVKRYVHNVKRYVHNVKRYDANVKRCTPGIGRRGNYFLFHAAKIRQEKTCTFQLFGTYRQKKAVSLQQI